MIINTVIAGGGTTPTGTLPITNNGTYDVSTYANADVNVPTTAPAYYIEKSVDANGKLLNGSSFINLNGVTDIGAYALEYAYNNNQQLLGDIEISGIETLTGESAFEYCFARTKITSFSMPNLKKITNNQCFSYAFNSITTLVSINFSKLEIVGAGNRTNVFGNAFQACTGLITAAFDNVVYVYSGGFSNAFYGCTHLASISYKSLKIADSNNIFMRAFYNCPITELRFPAITNNSFNNTYALNNMCNGVANITLHFPSNVQSTIEALSGYSTTAPFGATTGTVLFDLPATVILTGANSQTYERSPKDDTGTALAWRKQDTGTASNLVIDWTPFYTSGTTDPAVNGTIYSDSACTTAVTTISSIA